MRLHFHLSLRTYPKTRALRQRRNIRSLFTLVVDGHLFPIDLLSTKGTEPRKSILDDPATRLRIQLLTVPEVLLAPRLDVGR